MSPHDEYEEAVGDALAMNPPVPREVVLARRERLRLQTLAHIAKTEAPECIRALESYLRFYTQAAVSVAEREAPAVIAALEDMLRREGRP